MALSRPSFLRGLPANSITLIATLLLVNLAIFLLLALPILITHPRLAPPAALSYALGLRHALDADHIAAIDLTTRRLIASGHRPASVGTFFSLGHSTVVVLTCVAVAATSGALRDRFDGLARVGNIVGTAVSALFLIVLCAGNAWVLHRLICRLRAAIAQQQGGTAVDENEPIYSGVNEYDGEDDDDGEVQRLAAGQQFTVEGGGILTTLLRRLFKAIDRPWKMYPLGFVFGLGFDTSSEIAILGIASIQAVQGTSIWLILLFPILFTAGMCLLDTTDGALMLALYTSKAFSRDPVAILYYSAVLTAITVVVSAFIGVVQVLSLIQNVVEPDGPFWDGVEAIGDYFDVIGACICGVFLLVGLGSIAVYGPWRRRMERRSRGEDQEGRYVTDEPTGIPEEGESPTQRTPLISHTHVAGRGT